MSQGKILEDFLDFLNKCIEEVSAYSEPNSTPSSIVKVSCLWTFWQQLEGIAAQLSFNCTKVCLAFMEPPRPDDSEIGGLIKDVQTVCTNLVMVVKMLPFTFGMELVREVCDSVTNALQAVQRLIGLTQIGTEQMASEYRKHTGIAWEGCKVIKECPRNNALAVLRALTRQAEMVSDAYSEITESLKGEGKNNWKQFQLAIQNISKNSVTSEADISGLEEEAVWSEEDKVYLTAPANIIKGVKLLYKRFSEAIKDSDCASYATKKPSTSAPLSDKWQSLDNVRAAAEKLPEHVDDLVITMYPPIDYNNLQKNAHDLVDVALDSITKMQLAAVGTEDTPQHLQFLHTVFTHNIQLIDTRPHPSQS